MAFPLNLGIDRLLEQFRMTLLTLGLKLKSKNLFLQTSRCSILVL